MLICIIQGPRFLTGAGCTARSIVPELRIVLEGCSCLSSHEVARSDNHTACLVYESVRPWTSRSRWPGTSAPTAPTASLCTRAGATPASRWRSPAGAAASAKRSSGTGPPMSFRRGAIVPIKAGRLHLVHTANGRAIAGRVEIPDTAAGTTNPWQPAAGQSYFLTTGEQ